jgi:serine/threonine protein kinase
MACKMITTNSGAEHVKAASMLLKEVKALAEVHHPNIVRLMGVCVDPDHLCILLEYAQRGNLRQVLEDNPDLPLWRRFQLLHGAALGLAALHAHLPRPILHGDIKTVNLLVTIDWICKHADFGMVTGLGTLPTATRGGGGGGTLQFTAPEVLNKEPYSLAAEIYAMGMVMFEVTTGIAPWDGCSQVEIMMSVIRGERPPIPAGCHPFLAAIITSCWAQDPVDRPSSAALATTFSGARGEEELQPPDVPPPPVP